MRNRLSLIIACIILLLFAFVSCSKHKETKSTTGPKPVLKIDDKEIFENSLLRFFDDRVSKYVDLSNLDEVKAKLFEDFVEEQLLLANAEKEGIKVGDTEIKQVLESLSPDPGGGSLSQVGIDREGEFVHGIIGRLKIEKYLQDSVLKGISVSDGEVRSYYEASNNEFRDKETVRVYEILVGSERMAEKIVALIKKYKKENFSQLAKFYSIGSSAVRGGDLGYYSRGELPEEFEKVIFALKPGQLSKAVRTQYGFHIFYLKHRTGVRQRGMAEVKNEIREKLLAEKQKAAIVELVSKLKSQAKITIYPNNLGFRYIASRI